jgi:hypothetical protein
MQERKLIVDEDAKNFTINLADAELENLFKIKENPTAENYNERGDRFYSYATKLKASPLKKAVVAYAIADYSESIKLDSTYQQGVATRSLKFILNIFNKREIFNFIQLMDHEAQIPLLEQCLSRKTVIGKWFHKTSTMGMLFDHDYVKVIKHCLNHLIEEKLEKESEKDKSSEVIKKVYI